MAIAYRNVSNGSGTSPTTVTAPTGIQTGDVMVIVILTTAGGSVTIPAGWTQIGTEQTGSYKSKAAYRIREAGDTSYTFTSSAGTMYWQVGAWSGGDTTDPIVASDFAVYSGINTPLPSLTASGVAGDAAIYSIMGEISLAYGTPTDYTERWDSGNSQAIGDRLGLTASQSTSGTAVCTDTETSHVLHAILRLESATWYDHDGVKPWSSIWRPGRV